MLGVIALNVLWLHWTWLGFLFGFLYLWINSRKLSDILSAKIHPGLKSVMGLLTILCYICLVYTIAYHVYKIDWVIFSFVIISIPAIVEFLSYRFNSTHYFFTGFRLGFSGPMRIRKYILPAITIICDIILLFYLKDNASLGVIRSPWELVSYKFWILFSISNLALIWSLFSKEAYKNIFLISWHFMLLSSVAIILYPLGYGYDSFIHRSVLEILNQTGTIQPRLFLYLGQYGLTFFTSQLGQISIADANAILLPILFSILWPTSIFYGLHYGLSWSNRAAYISVLLSVFLGFDFAIMTTPQGLSFLIFAFVVFLLPEIARKNIPDYFLWLLSLMTLSIHPLAGIPLLFLTALITLSHWDVNLVLRKAIGITTWAIALICLPVLLAVYQLSYKVPPEQIFRLNIPALLDFPMPSWQQSFSWPLDMIHNIGDNRTWIYAIICILGLAYVLIARKYVFFKKHLLLLSILAANFILAKIMISYNLQIAYQKDDYTNRILFLISLATLPIFLTAWYTVIKPVLSKKMIWSKTFLSAVIMIAVGVGVYFSYPIYDKWGNSKSFNVTQSDIKTVQAIEADAQGQPYIVLANQMVGAAAINQFGFAHYHKNNFYYSMPLGIDNIYSEFLSMIETEASRQTAEKAMEKADVDRVYFVVNNYWHSARRAINEASVSADASFEIDGGVNRVFVYKK